MASDPITSWQIEGEKVEAVTDFLFLGFKNTADGDCSHEIRCASWQESYDEPRQCDEKQRHYSANKSPYNQAYGFPSSHIWLWELDCKKGRAPKYWCLWTVVLQKTPESPLDSKIKPVDLKANQSWILVGRTDAETPIFWSPDVNSWLIGKVPDARKDWGQKKQRASEDEMARWHHQCNGHELGQTSGDGEGQEARYAAVYGVAKRRTQLCNWTTAKHCIGVPIYNSYFSAI